MTKTKSDRPAPDEMQLLERALDAELEERRQRLAAMTRLADRIRVAPAESAMDPRKTSPERVREQARLMQRSAHAREAPTVQAPTVPAAVGGVHVPPFDFEWTWSNGSGDFTIYTLSANAASGEAALDIDATGASGDAVAQARAAVGVSFTPPAPGLLQISTAPSFTYDWTLLCLQQSAISWGFVGIVVVSTSLDGTSPTTVVRTWPLLWSEDAWWSGSYGSGSSEGYAVAAQTPVSNDRKYSVWAWCGVLAEAGNDAWWWFALAFSTLSIKVPYITCVFSASA